MVRFSVMYWSSWSLFLLVVTIKKIFVIYNCITLSEIKMNPWVDSRGKIFFYDWFSSKNICRQFLFDFLNFWAWNIRKQKNSLVRIFPKKFCLQKFVSKKFLLQKLFVENLKCQQLFRRGKFKNILKKILSHNNRPKG